jgi:hypothetical protein
VIVADPNFNVLDDQLIVVDIQLMAINHTNLLQKTGEALRLSRRFRGPLKILRTSDILGKFRHQTKYDIELASVKLS